MWNSIEQKTADRKSNIIEKVCREYMILFEWIEKVDIIFWRIVVIILHRFSSSLPTQVHEYKVLL